MARPISEETIASLKAIADSPASQLPPNLAAAEEDLAVLEDATESAPAPRTEEGTPSGETPPSFVAPASWRSPGINPDEVNPGDLFFENRGPVLRKVFSLIDDLPASQRNPLLNQFTVSKTTRTPITLSRKEIAGLPANASGDTPLPTRSVALDCRTESHRIEPERHRALLDQLSKGESAGAIASTEQLARLKKQLENAKRRLRAGETLHIVTAVSESSLIHATYPGAPVGKRDAEPIRHLVSSLYPHLGQLEAAKGNESIELNGNPRLVWEFESREVKLVGDEIVIAGENEPGP